MKKSITEELLREVIRKEIKQTMLDEGLFSFFDNWLESLEEIIDGEIEKLKGDISYGNVKKNKKLYGRIKKKVGNDEKKIKAYIKNMEKSLKGR